MKMRVILSVALIGSAALRGQVLMADDEPQRRAEAACEMDLEGIVAKRALAPYAPEPPSWIKVKNPAYTRAMGLWMAAETAESS